MRTATGLSDHRPADLQSPEPGTLTRFSAGEADIHTKKELLLRGETQEQFYFLSFIRYFFMVQNSVPTPSGPRCSIRCA